MATDPPPESRPPVDWRRAAEGIQLAGFAVFLLLNTTGHLPWSFWIDAIALWPVLLMSAGLRMAVDRTRAPWLQLLSPVLVLGTLGWLAGTQRPVVAARDWSAVSLARADAVDQVRLEGHLLGTRVAARAAPLPEGQLVEGRVASRRGTARLEDGVDGTTAEVRVEGPRRGGTFFWMPGAADQWDLRLPESLPLSLQLGGAMSRLALDFTSGRLRRSAVEGVFLGVDLKLPRPEEDTEIRVAGVFNAVAISVPAGTPVRVHGPGLPFNLRDRGTKGTGPGYDVHLAGVFSAATVEARPDEGPAPARPPASDPSAVPSPPAEDPGPSGR